MGYSQIAHIVMEKAISCGRSPLEITLIAVSKTHPLDSLVSIYQEGCRDFGESRLQEAMGKIMQLPPDCRWHLIGSLQNNKVVKAISAFQLIHSVDSPELAKKISEVSQAKGVSTSILLQVNTSGEMTKRGFSSTKWASCLDIVNALPNIKIEGLMTMAPLTEDQHLIRACFRKLYQLRENWRSQMKEPPLFRHLSMGMSHDFLIAIEEGATLLRIGSAIFDKRTSIPLVTHLKDHESFGFSPNSAPGE